VCNPTTASIIHSRITACNQLWRVDWINLRDVPRWRRWASAPSCRIWTSSNSSGWRSSGH
ncbi:hypothetical protein CPB97_009723, partial [Podila verticillata]